MGYERRKRELHLFIRGWMEYFKLADMRHRLQRIDEWFRRRLRMCIWKCWKKVRTRFSHLHRLGIDRSHSWQYANTRLGYWRIAGSVILSRSINNDKLKQAGYPFLLDYYSKLHRK